MWLLLEENGTDPLSGEPLTAEDLVEVKASKFTAFLSAITHGRPGAGPSRLSH